MTQHLVKITREQPHGKTVETVELKPGSSITFEAHDGEGRSIQVDDALKSLSLSLSLPSPSRKTRLRAEPVALGTAPRRLAPGVWRTRKGRKLSAPSAAYWEKRFRQAQPTAVEPAEQAAVDPADLPGLVQLRELRLLRRRQLPDLLPASLSRLPRLIRRRPPARRLSQAPSLRVGD
jgi:hypothetical protein